MSNQQLSLLYGWEVTSARKVVSHVKSCREVALRGDVLMFSEGRYTLGEVTMISDYLRQNFGGAAVWTWQGVSNYHNPLRP